MSLSKIDFNTKLKNVNKHCICSSHNPLIIPFTKESPFTNAFKKTFETMRRVGILSDILKNYKTSEKTQCGSPKVSKSRS